MLEFKCSPRMSLGVEIELQLIDPESRDLSNETPRVFRMLGEEETSIKPEIFRSMVEVVTGVCDTVEEVRADLDTAVARLRSACDRIGVVLAGAGSHPFARHRQRLVFPADRFDFLIDRNRWVAKRLMIFALHLHVGMRDGDHAMAMMNGMSHYLPHALALSASSPYWQGSDTGLASSRITIFEAMPTSGSPCLFHNWSEFRSFYEAATRAGALTTIKDLWWDIRPHPDLGTLEIRICDGLPTVSEVVGVVAFLQSIYAWLDARYQDGEELRGLPMWMLRENKWRATRWGIEADIVVDANGETRPLLGEIEKLFEIVEPHFVSVGAAEEVARVQRRLRAGLPYERQRAVYDITNDLVAVTDTLVEEFNTDRPFSD